MFNIRSDRVRIFCNFSNSTNNIKTYLLSCTHKTLGDFSKEYFLRARTFFLHLSQWYAAPSISSSSSEKKWLNASMTELQWRMSSITSWKCWKVVDIWEHSRQVTELQTTNFVYIFKKKSCKSKNILPKQYIFVINI